MADIPGFKKVRLLKQLPAVVPDFVPHIFFAPDPKHTLELQFDDDSIINVPISQKLHDEIQARMLAQKGVGIEQRMAARGALAEAGDSGEVAEELIPLDATTQDVRSALQRVTKQQEREGAGLPCAWFCYLWHNYKPGSHEQEENVRLASCARCGRCMPRDPERQKRPCKGKVEVALRGLPQR